MVAPFRIRNVKCVWCVWKSRFIGWPHTSIKDLYKTASVLFMYAVCHIKDEKEAAVGQMGFQSRHFSHIFFGELGFEIIDHWNNGMATSKGTLLFVFIYICKHIHGLFSPKIAGELLHKTALMAGLWPPCIMHHLPSTNMLCCAQRNTKMMP